MLAYPSLEENVWNFARSPTVCPIYLLSERWQNQKKLCTSTCRRLLVLHGKCTARSEAYPCCKHNPSRLSEPNQWPVADKPVSQAFEASRKQREFCGYHGNQLEWWKIIPGSDFVRKWCGIPGSVTVTRTLLCDEGCRLDNNHFFLYSHIWLPAGGQGTLRPVGISHTNSGPTFCPMATWSDRISYFRDFSVLLI